MGEDLLSEGFGVKGLHPWRLRVNSKQSFARPLSQPQNHVIPKTRAIGHVKTKKLTPHFFKHLQPLTPAKWAKGRHGIC